MAAVTSLPSKVVRAIRWYFLQNGATDSEHCLHNFDWRERKFNGQPIVDVFKAARIVPSKVIFAESPNYLNDGRSLDWFGLWEKEMTQHI